MWVLVYIIKGPASLRFVTIANNISGADAPTAGPVSMSSPPARSLLP